METIAVCVPAYRDDDLSNTLDSAIIQARHPERLYFAICLQDDRADIAERLAARDNMSVAWIPERYARGACYARYLCQATHPDTDFVFRIDAHMRFVKGWDEALIGQWSAIGDPMGIISYFLNGFTDAEGYLPFDHPVFDSPRFGSIIKAHSLCFGNSYWPFMDARYYREEDMDTFKHNRHVSVAGHYFFAPGRVDKDVVMDPFMHHRGDELPYAIRLFTYGYNIYGTNRAYAMHKWPKRSREIPGGFQDEAENGRVEALIGLRPDIDLGKYGLGNARTYEEFVRISGIDAVRGVLSEDAKAGRYDDRFDESDFVTRERLLEIVRKEFG